MLTEFQDYLRCGRVEYGFVRVECNGCRHEHLVACSCKRRGFCPSCGARTGVVTLIQRFGSALNLNVHPHMLILDGVYTTEQNGPRFHRVGAPETQALERLLNRLVRRIFRRVTRDGFSLNACVACQAHQRDRLERLCRYITRPAPGLSPCVKTMARFLSSRAVGRHIIPAK